MAIRREALELAVRFVLGGTQQLDQAARDVKKLADAGQQAGEPLRNLADRLQQSGEASLSFFGTISRGAAITAGAAASLGLIAKSAFDLVAGMGAAAEQTSNFADRLGISIREAQRLQAAAKIAGVEVGSLEGAARTLSTALEDSSGQGERTAAALAKLGVQTRTISGDQRDMGKVLLETLTALSRVENTSERVFLAMRTLPRGAAVELLPLIKNFDELKQTIDQIGVGMDDGLIDRLSKADDEIGKLSVSWESFKRSIAGRIAPIIIPVIATLQASLQPGNNTASVNSGVGAEAFSGAEPLINPGFDVNGARRLRRANNAQSLLGQEQARGRDIVAAFRRTRSTTEAGQRALLKSVELQLGEIDAKLADGIGGTAAQQLVSDFGRLESQRQQIESRIKAFEDARKKDPNAGALRITDLFAKEAERLGKRVQRPSLLRPDERARALEAGALDLPFVARSGEFIARPVDSEAARDRDKAISEGIVNSDRERTQLAKDRRQAETEAAVRLLELMGNEYAAAARTRDLRLETATSALDARKAELDYAVRIVEIEERRRQKNREDAGRVFDAITASGGGGLRDFGRGLLRQQERALFQNASAGLFSTAGSVLGRIGEASGLGRLLEGTLFDPKNAQQPVDRNTAAIEKQTKATEQLTTALVGGPGASGVGAIAGIFGSDTGGLTGSRSGGGILGRIFGGGSSGGGGFLAGLGSVFSGGGLFGLGSGSIRTGEGQATTLAGLGKGGRLGNTIGSIGLLAGGGLAIASGIREGGASGVLGAVSGGLSIASAIPGPQQPFLQAAAMVAGFVKTLLPDKRAQFDAEQNALLAQRRYTAPDAIANNFDFATGSDQTDFDWRGRVRVIVNRVVNVNVSALDARSVLERGDDIAEAVRQQVEAGHPLGLTMTNTVLGTA